MSFQSSLGALGASIGAALSSAFAPKKEEKPEDKELKQAKIDYYKQKTASLKNNESLAKAQTKFRNERTKYWKSKRQLNESKTNLNNLKIDELKAKITKQQEKINLNSFDKAVNSSAQAVAKKAETQNLATQNLNNIASQENKIISTDGTTTNIPVNEDLAKLREVQERSWKRSVAASQNAETMWAQRRKAESSGYGSIEDVDNSFSFSGRTSENDLKNFGLTKQQLREWALNEDPSKAAEEFEKFANSKGVYVSINSDEYDSMDKVGELIERTIRHNKVVNANSDWKIPEDYDEKKDTYKVWPTEEAVGNDEIKL